MKNILAIAKKVKKSRFQIQNEGTNKNLNVKNWVERFINLVCVRILLGQGNGVREKLTRSKVVSVHGKRNAGTYWKKLFSR